MNFEINSDTWFIFSIFFICALALLILMYIAIPLIIRIRQIKRRKLRHNKTQNNYKQLTEKYEKRKIIELKNNNDKLQIPLSPTHQHTKSKI